MREEYKMNIDDYTYNESEIDYFFECINNAKKNLEQTRKSVREKRIDEILK